jgi:acetyl esterase/lipase
MEFGRRLEYYHKYQKLALPDELKRMEQMARDNGLGDLQPLAPILTQIANDPSLMNQVRASAQRLLAAGNAGTK